MKQPRIQVIVFAGTTEGRRLGEELAAVGVGVLLCVATEYGGELVQPNDKLQVRRGRMDTEEIRNLITHAACGLVVDATHPYAQIVTENIHGACGEAGAKYLRLMRHGWDGKGVVAADSMEEAAKILSKEGGRALLTVGSKELEAFAVVPDYRNRLTARVLPMRESVEKCLSLGFGGKHLICMQGPFSHELNVATLRDIDADWLVTKDSGEPGGFYQKLSAARETGARLLLVRRPEEGAPGLSYEEVWACLLKELELKQNECPQGFPRFPLFLNLAGKAAVVVGGGTVGRRRAETLLRCGADVTVISPVTGANAFLQADGRLHWEKRAYRSGDLSGAVLVVAATNDRKVNRQVADEAKRLEIPYSVADDPEQSSFWFPALVQKKNLVVGVVSTDGDHRAVRKMADRLRQNAEEE